MQRLLLIVACSTLLCDRAVAADASVSGTWAYVERWETVRGDSRRNFYAAPAIVLHFCPNGQFTMLKCMLYRQGHEYITIGSDDGLQIYRGTWSAAADGAVVTYHLADAEIPFTGYESAKKREIKASATLASGTLQMRVVRFFSLPMRDFLATFRPKAHLPAPLQERFIDCGEHPDKT